MTSESEKKLKEIVAKIERLDEAYGLHDSAVLRGVAVRKDNKWFNTLSILAASSSSLHPVQEEIEYLGDRGIVSYRVPMSREEAIEMLTEIHEKKQFRVSKKRIFLTPDEKKAWRWENGREVGSYEAKHRYPYECGLVDYFVNCNFDIWMLRELDSDIRKLGYDSVDELLLDKVIWDSGRYRLRSSDLSKSGIHIIIPHYHLFIKEVRFDRDNVIVTLGGVLPEDGLDDHYLTIRINPSFEERLRPFKIEQLSMDEIKVPLTCEVYSAEARLWWKKGRIPVEDFVDWSHGRRALSSQNVRIASYLQFDPEFKALLKCLDPKETNSKKIEWTASVIFHLAGLNTTWLGYPGGLMESEVDVLCFAKDYRTVVAVECTTASGAIEQKVAEVYRKIGRLEKALDDWRIIGVVFTNLESESLTESEKESASRQGIALIASEEVRRIISLLKEDAPLDEVLNGIRNCVPIRPRDFVL